MVCATVCLTVVPSFSDTTVVSTISHSSKTDRSRTPLFHVAQYGDDIIGRELNLKKLPVGSGNRAHKPYEQLRPIMIKTNASTESATAAYITTNLRWFNDVLPDLYGRESGMVTELLSSLQGILTNKIFLFIGKDSRRIKYF